jgi:hypothetical protein
MSAKRGRPPFGVRHLTVVPTNADPTASDEDDPAATN